MERKTYFSFLFFFHRYNINSITILKRIERGKCFTLLFEKITALRRLRGFVIFVLFICQFNLPRIDNVFSLCYSR